MVMRTKASTPKSGAVLQAKCSIKMRPKLCHLLALTAFAFATPATSWAQQEEIIVTADKHGEALAHDLPVTMSVFSADDLEGHNFEDLQSLTYAMPNVQLEDIGTAHGIANFSIRGVGVNSSIASVDPAVGLFVDGVYYGVNAGAITDNFDIEAVEVLRGPQGALYGRNVTGGAVLVRTREPTDHFEAMARTAVETGPSIISEAMISGPLAPGVLNGRLSMLASSDDGWFHNDATGTSFGASETRAWRATLQLTPTPAFDAILRVEQGYADGDGPAGQNHALFSRSGFDFSIDNPGYSNTEWRQASLETNWRVGLGDGTITSLTAHRSVDLAWAADIDSTPAFVFHTRVFNAHEQTSQELRYAGGFGPVAVVVGAYYLRQSLLYIDERNFSSSFRRTGGGQGDFESWAAFTNADWRWSDTLTFSTGIRYSHEEKVSHISRVRRAADDLNGPSVSVAGEGFDGGDIDLRSLVFSDSPFDQSWNDLSPRIALQWRPQDSTNVYASWSQAFRGGGANFRTASLGLAPRAYDPEAQSTFELGWKQQFTRGRFNAAIFRNDIADMQRETNQPDPISGVQQIILNAGDATLWGAEFEASVDLTEAVRLQAHAGYVDGAYEHISEDLNGDLVIDSKDMALHIPRLAPWSYGVSIEYETPLLTGSLRARASYSHRDGAFYNDNNLGRLAEIDMFDFNLRYAPTDGNWSISLYGENLSNDPSWGGDTILPSTVAFGYTGGALASFSPLNKGRVFGLALTLRAP